MTNIYNFSLSESAAIVENAVEDKVLQEHLNCTAIDIVQAAVEEFGIEFPYGGSIRADELLMRAGVSAEVAEATYSALKRSLYRTLLWTEGAAMSGPERLMGTIDTFTLQVRQGSRMELNQLIAAEAEGDAWYPERLRRLVQPYR